MSNIDKQALREEFQFMRGIYSDPADHKRQLIYIAAEALLDELEAAEKRNAELESRTVTLPAQKYCPAEYAGSVLWGETEVWNQAISECAKAIRAAGIGKGE